MTQIATEKEVVKEPTAIGEKLLHFAEHGAICTLLAKAICTSCDASSCDDSDCPSNCPGLAILGHLENQVGQEGIKLMRLLVEEFSQEQAHETALH